MSVLATQSNINQVQVVDNKLMPLAPSYVGPAVHAQTEQSLSDVLSILNRRKWTILLALFSTLALVAWYTFSINPSYRANATIQIEREGAEIVNFGRTQKSADSVDSLNDPFFRTRYEMLRGRVVAQKVIDDLSLESSLSPKQSKSFLSSTYSSVLGFFGLKEEEQNAYFNLIQKIITKGNYVLIAVFALDGAEKCCGLDLKRYNVDMLQNQLGNDFQLIDSFNHLFINPFGSERPYIYTLFQRQ